MAVAVQVRPATRTETVQPQLQPQLQPLLLRFFVKRLLEFSFGAIAFQRNLLPDEAFIEKRLKDDPQVAMKTFKEGVCQQADALTALLAMKTKAGPAGGISDAIKNRYLRKLSFVILLDPSDRDKFVGEVSLGLHTSFSVIESYTFNFSYSPATGTPAISLSQYSSATSLQSSSSMAAPTTATELHMTLKHFISTLNLMIAELPDLPRQRYVDLRLEYTDDTPTNYHAANFQPTAGSHFITTHNMDDVPEAMRVGHFTTGDHKVSLLVSSAAKYLPRETEVGNCRNGEGAPSHERRKTSPLANSTQQALIWDPETFTTRPSAMGFSATSVAAIPQVIIGRRGERTKDWVLLEEDDETLWPAGANRQDSLLHTHTSLTFINRYSPTDETNCFQSSGGLDESSPPSVTASLAVDAPKVQAVLARPPKAFKTPKASAAPTVPKRRQTIAPPRARKSQKQTAPKSTKNPKVTSVPKGQVKVPPPRNGQPRTVGRARPPATVSVVNPPRHVGKTIGKAPKAPNPPSMSPKKTLKTSRLVTAREPSDPNIVPASQLRKTGTQLATQSVSTAPSAPSNTTMTHTGSLDEVSDTNPDPLPTIMCDTASFGAPSAHGLRFGRMMSPLDFGVAE